MFQDTPAWRAHVRQRMRTNAHLAIRHDVYRFMPPGSPRYVGKDVVRYFWPDPQDDQTSQADERKNQCDLAAERGELLWMQRELVAIKAELKLLQLLRDSKAYNPNQPRVPAGSREGGQWTNGNAGTRVRVASIGRTIVQLLKAALKLRLSPSDNAARRARDMLNRVRHLDPLWQPNSNSDEGIAQEAEKRLAEFAALPADRLIAIYRAQNSMPDLFGQPTWRLDKGTVAVTKVDGVPEFGVNSKAPDYEGKDTATADTMRRLLIETYPEEMKRSNNIGRMPNDSVYHAEATILFRAARRYEGTLEGRTIDVYVDREMCRSCDKVLPLIGQELGNPTVTYVDLRSGETATMRDGKWIDRTRP
jgi:hypothetical protein